MTLKVIRRLQAFSSAIRGTFVQHCTRFQLTVCLHGSSALAELLVSYCAESHRRSPSPAATCLLCVCSSVLSTLWKLKNGKSNIQWKCT